MCEVRVLLKDESGSELVGTDLYELAKSLSGVGTEPKESLEIDAMSIVVEKNGCRLKVMFH